MAAEQLQQDYDQLCSEARRLAGGLTDLSRRATVYHHVYRESGGNHVFPLIAAHGALWAGGYFQFGLRLGELLAWQFVGRRQTRHDHLDRLQQFADSIREINRLVCIDTYVNFHFTRRHGADAPAAEFVPAELLEALNRVHAANAAGAALSDSERRAVFAAHFLHEQTHVVGPRIEAAVAALDWPLLQVLALKPIVRFAYFPTGQRLWFHNFASRKERIGNGLRAFDWAAAAGWDRAEQALSDYQILPPEFFVDTNRYFTELRHRLVGAMI